MVNVLITVGHSCASSSASCIVQCAKQPYGLVSCGFYVCKYRRTCNSIVVVGDNFKKHKVGGKRRRSTLSLDKL